MNVQQLITAARQRYNAVDDPFYSDDELMTGIYQAQMDMANEAMVIEKTYTTTSVADQQNYSYPDTAISIRRVEYDGCKLYPKPIEWDPKTSTTNPTGTPQYYAQWNDELLLFNTPDTTGLTIKVYAYDEPDPVVLTGELNVPVEYHLYIVDFLLSIMYAKDQNLNMSTYHRNLWLSQLQTIKRSNARKKRGDQAASVADNSINVGDSY